MVSLYNLFISLLHFGIRSAAPWNEKAKEWVHGRRHVWEDLEQQLPQHKNIIWFHIASAGEFEQGRPLMEALKMLYPSHALVVSFFSSSGYKVAKKSSLADYIFYLPLDTKKHAERLMLLMKPRMAVFVKYDIWYHHFNAIINAHIPALLVSAVFRKQQLYFRPYGSFYRNLLPRFKQIFVQDEASLQLLATHGVHNATRAGDTRIDRVITIKDGFTDIAFIKEFAGDGPVLVAGSTWPEDEELLREITGATSGLKIILAPHEIDTNHLKTIRDHFGGALFYSEVKTGLQDPSSAQVMVIDNVGMLSRLYHYATIAFIGGGFSKDGIHNALEAAVFGKPLIWGPNYQKYREAVELIEGGAARSVSTKEELKQEVAGLLGNVDQYNNAANAALRYVDEKRGATEKIVRYIQENRLLTS